MESKFHRMVEAALAGNVGLNTGGTKTPNLSRADYLMRPGNGYVYKKRDIEEFVGLVGTMSHTPKFCLDPKLLEAFPMDDVAQSIEAMYEAGAADLPFEEVIIEFDDRQASLTCRTFVLVAKRSDEYRVSRELSMEKYPWLALRLRLREFEGDEYVVASPNLMFFGLGPDADAGDGETGFGAHYATIPAPYLSPENDEEVRAVKEAMTGSAKRDIKIIDTAISYLIVLLATKGVSSVRVPAPHKLNKHRVRKGKPPVSDHIVLRIGHVYDEAGNRHEYTGTGRTVRVHHRRAHNKMQPHGAAWLAANPDEAAKPGNTQTHHLVHIPAVLVNYRPGVVIPDAPQYLVKP